jgi:DNA polymerase I-like protein with 3'-5' exonuclease and polymerase domains
MAKNTVPSIFVPASSSRYTALVELTGQSADLEKRLKPTTAELNGFSLRVNKTTWLKNLAAAEETCSFWTDYCRYLTDDEFFRPNSGQDCVRALIKRNHRLRGTDKESLLELATKGEPLADAIVFCRSAIVCRSQLTAWKCFAEAGSVRSWWDSCGTPMGRYTSEAPCLTNRIPLIRESIEPPEGWSFLSLDLGQAEFCTWASLSGDEWLSRAFLEGKDFHEETALEVQRLVPNWDLRGEAPRTCGKTINFAILYQMRPPTLARLLGTTIETAESIIIGYYHRAERAALFIDDTLAQAEEFGHCSTYFGRRRYCPEYRSCSGAKEIHEQSKSLWHHVNAGTAAEFTKLRQARIWEALRRNGLSTDHVRLSLNVFDELIFSVRNDLLDEVKEIAEEIWREPEGHPFLLFPSTTKVGSNWLEVSK